MFSFLFELMGGEHEELSPRRRSDHIEFQRDVQGFVAEERVVDETRWLGRGEVPGAPMADAAGAAGGQTVADETRQLLDDATARASRR